MPPESEEETMRISTELEMRRSLFRENDGTAVRSVSSSPLISSAFAQLGWDRAFDQPLETGVGPISRRSLAEVSMARVIEDDEHDRHEREWSRLREPELELAVDRLIAALERNQMEMR
jgi:hypothetical protein